MKVWVYLLLAAAVLVPQLTAQEGVTEDLALALQVEDVLSESDQALLGPPQGKPMEGDLLDKRTEEVAARMRCPVCQGLSVADSSTPAAVAMKGRVRGLLAAGYGEEQVLRYFEASYGEFIRLAPKPQGLNLVAWVLPVVVLVLAAAWLALRGRRFRATSADSDLSDYLAQVRREVE